MSVQALVSSLGYTYLDVRPALELEEVGKVKESVNIPIVNAKRKYDSETRKKTLVKEDNPDFVAQVCAAVSRLMMLAAVLLFHIYLVLSCLLRHCVSFASTAA